MTLSAKERSERMKKAWATRRKNLSSSSGRGAVKEPIAFQIPSKVVVAEVENIVQTEFFDYIEFARTHRDSEILSSKKFGSLEKLVRETLGYK